MRGACKCCWLPTDDLALLESLAKPKPGRRHGRLPNGLLRRFGVSRRMWCRHARGKCAGRFPYHVGPESERRRREGERLWRWRWKPGESGRVQSARAKLEAAERRRLAEAYREAAAGGLR